MDIKESRAFHLGETVTFISVNYIDGIFKATPINSVIDGIDEHCLIIKSGLQECRVATDLNGVNSTIDAKVLYHGHDRELVDASFEIHCDGKIKGNITVKG